MIVVVGGGTVIHSEGCAVIMPNGLRGKERVKTPKEKNNVLKEKPQTRHDR